MKNIKRFLLFAAITIVGYNLSSCNKYEDGANISLVSAKKRFAQDWTLTNLTKNGENQNIEGYTQFFSFSKSGTYTQTVTVQSIWGPITAKESGTWVFSSDKRNVSLTKDGESTSNSFKFLELRKTQFKVRYVDDGDEYTRTFVSK